MRIAVVGSGIAGLTAAYRLADQHEVTLYEADSRLGGHTNTIRLTLGKVEYALDTGFLVYNERTYPNFSRLLAELEVETQPSEMSFSVRSDVSGWEYCGSSLSGLFAQRANLLRPAFYRMLRDILRFNREALQWLHGDEPDESLGSYLHRRAFGGAFQQHYLLPMGAAIWSAPPGAMLEFPARYFLRFFAQHGLLQLSDRPQWRTVSGGAASYIDAMRRLRPLQVKLNSAVRNIVRHPDRVRVDCGQASAEFYDHVVIAAHADQALRMLGDSSAEERNVLGAFRYQRNKAVLHTDTSLLPRRRRAWASWNYRVARDSSAARVTYWLNRLQTLSAPCEFCLTLNDEPSIDPARILRRIVYDHPLYTPRAVAAQQRHAQISGPRRTHFCGAYWGHGFHEDGVNSALAVVSHFNSDLESCTVASTKAGWPITASAR